LLPKDHILFYVALSFEIGLLSGFVLLPFYLRSRSRLLKFGFSRFSFVPVFSVLKASLSFLLFFGLQFARNFILIKVATSAFRSEAEMNTYAITSNLVFVLDLFVTSLIQMIPATVSSLYGEKDYSGVRFIVKKVLLLSLVSSSILWIATLSYPKLFLYIFGMGATAVSSDYDLVIRFYSIAILLYMANRFIQTYYPCISSNLPSLINTILEKGALGIPLGVSLMLSYSVLGYSLGSTLSEALALMITAVFLLFYRKKKQASSLLLPKGDPNRPRYEWTVSFVNEVEEASAFVKEKVLEAGGQERTATYLALGAEELLFNDFQYGYPKNRKDWGVDLALSKEGSSFLLSLKDDGIPFDPIAHREEEGPQALFHGLPLLKKVASRLDYTRIINLNETVMEMDEA
jgi:anti-sigma regulatory factor (Ser/Thr protein kinase)